jgi:hypothetical protein
MDNISEQITDEENKPKKRGRKPKNKTNEVVEVKIPKKRGRKPKGKVMQYAPPSNSKSTDDNDNIIVHIPLKMTDLFDDDDRQSDQDKVSDVQEFNNIFTTSDVKSGPNLFEISDTPEEHYDYCKRCKNYEDEIKELKGMVNTMSSICSESATASVRERKVYMMDIDFVNLEGEKQEWVESTSVYCWWCVHPFENPPCPLTDKYYDNKYYIFGCFCSFNCALSYNDDLDDYKTGQRKTLLLKLYHTLFNTKEDIMSAPGRETLEIFGGPLTIEHFREHSRKCIKEFRFIMPPMVSIISLIEEDYRDKNKNGVSNKYVPLSSQKVQLARENLKIKRSKPLSHEKFSLEKTMGLRKKHDA